MTQELRAFVEKTNTTFTQTEAGISACTKGDTAKLAALLADSGIPKENIHMGPDGHVSCHHPVLIDTAALEPLKAALGVSSIPEAASDFTDRVTTRQYSVHSEAPVR